MDRDRILLTPGPLTTTLRTKLAMLKDWGSWDADFNALTAGLRTRQLDIVHGHGIHVLVPLPANNSFLSPDAKNNCLTGCVAIFGHPDEDVNKVAENK